MDLFRHQRLKRVRARWIADTDSHSVANAIGQKLDKLMERLDKVRARDIQFGGALVVLLGQLTRNALLHCRLERR